MNASVIEHFRRLKDPRIERHLNRVNLSNARLSRADMGADMSNQGMVPVRVQLTGAVLNGADLSGANLTHAILSYAHLRGANLKGVKLIWADLAGADLSGADVSGADFSHAELAGARLGKLTGANTARGLKR